MTKRSKMNSTGIYVDENMASHLRILYPNADAKFESGEYTLKFLKIKNLSKLHKYYQPLSEYQHTEFDEIILDNYDISEHMDSEEKGFYKTFTRTEKSEKQNEKFFAIGEVKGVYVWNFDFWIYNSFKAITFKITDDTHRMIDGLFVYDRKNCKENIYSNSQLEDVLGSTADSMFKIQFQALPTLKETEFGQIQRPRLLRIYDFKIIS